MWEAIKVICGLILLAGVILAVVSTAFIFSWVFKILGFLIAALLVVTILGYVIIELVGGWWQDRKEQKKAPK